MTCRYQLLLLFIISVTTSGFAPQNAHGNAQLKTQNNMGNALRRTTATTGKRTNDATKLDAWTPFKKEEPVVAIVEEDVPTEFSPGPLDKKNAIAATTWVALVTWAFLFAPGPIGSDADNAMINRLISQPTPRPEEINELWFAVWNSFTIVPAAIGALAATTGRGQRLPAAPFLLGSAFLGYFSLGPYFATRTDRSGDESQDLRQADLGFFSKNLFENRIFGLLLSAIAISIPFSSDLVVSGFDWSAKVAELVSLVESSRFVAVASVDIVIMSIVAAVLVSEDCKLRGWGDKSTPLFFATLLLPALGPSLYLAARPSLEE